MGSVETDCSNNVVFLVAQRPHTPDSILAGVSGFVVLLCHNVLSTLKDQRVLSELELDFLATVFMFNVMYLPQSLGFGSICYIILVYPIKFYLWKE